MPFSADKHAEMQVSRSILTTSEHAELELLEQLELDEEERTACEASLLTFFQRAWREIDPAELSISWHHEAICEHLEAITFGQLRNLIINIPPRHTKALDVETPVFTTWGWKRHGDIQTGDYVFGPDGWPRRVTGVSPQTIQPSYQVTFDDGSALLACGEHLWEVERDYPYGGLAGKRVRRIEIASTKELQPTVSGRSPRSPTRPDRIPLAKAIQMPPRRLLIDPYALGAWLGDGTSLSASMTVGQDDIDHFRSLGTIVRADDRNATGRITYRLRMERDLQTKLRILGLLGNKHIPQDYLESSEDQRWELLRGLMDTDGNCAKDGTCRFITHIRDLGDQFGILLASLGIKGYRQETWSMLNGKGHGPYQEFRFRGAGETIFKMARKQSRVRPPTKRATGRYVTSVEPIGERLVNCIKVEGELYLAGKAMITTHNTMLVNIIWPAWTWAREQRLPLSGAHVKFLSVSYGATLAEEIALKMLRLVQGEWYQRLWGRRVNIHSDQKSRASFGTIAGGERLSNSIEGGILGRGGDIKIIDDPQTRRGADSEIERAASLRGMSDLTTRVTDPRIAAQVLIMQRLHVNDATDWALKNWPEDGTVHLMFPARYEPDRACAVDPRKHAGELLWPAVWTDDELRNIEAGLNALDGDRLSDYAVAGQLQQNPKPKGGGIFKREWIEPWPPLSGGAFPADMVVNGRIQYPAFEYVVACIDTAFTMKQSNDRSAMVVLGVFRAEGKGRIEKRGDGAFIRVADDYGFPKVLVMYGWAKRLELHGPPEEIPEGVTREEWASPRYRAQRQNSWGLVEWVADTCTRYKADDLVVLTLGQGHGLEQELRRLHSDADWGVTMEVERGDKAARAYAVQHLFSSRQIYAPMYEDGTMPTWCEPLITELTDFNPPHSRFDDFVDATCGALRRLREMGLMERREEFDRAEERSMSWPVNRRVALPYDI